MSNFNNPEMSTSNNYSTVSTDIDNKFINNDITDSMFVNSDPVLNNSLPKLINLNINPGLTSPGFLDNAGECTGIGF